MRLNIKNLILTEAGKQYGYGHLMRCLAIAQGFKEINIDSVFYIRSDSTHDLILKEFSYYCVDWIKENIDVSEKTVILDSYHTDVDICKNIYNKAKKVLFIDDYSRIPYPGGFVLNSVIGAEEIGYPVQKRITYLLGPKYHPLRREFWNIPSKEIKLKIEKILITFGGSDLTNETPRILTVVKEHYPELKKYVIIGNGFSNIDGIRFAADDKTFLIFEPDAEKIMQEMLECDV